MVILEFVDGSKEDVETDYDGYKYNERTSMFEVSCDGYWIMYPREFVKSIRYMPVV